MTPALPVYACLHVESNAAASAYTHQKLAQLAVEMKPGLLLGTEATAMPPNGALFLICV